MEINIWIKVESRRLSLLSSATCKIQEQSIGFRVDWVRAPSVSICPPTAIKLSFLHPKNISKNFFSSTSLQFIPKFFFFTILKKFKHCVELQLPLRCSQFCPTISFCCSRGKDMNRVELSKNDFNEITELSTKQKKKKQNLHWIDIFTLQFTNNHLKLLGIHFQSNKEFFSHKYEPRAKNRTRVQARSGISTTKENEKKKTGQWKAMTRRLLEVSPKRHTWRRMWKTPILQAYQKCFVFFGKTLEKMKWL